MFQYMLRSRVTEGARCSAELAVPKILYELPMPEVIMDERTPPPHPHRKNGLSKRRNSLKIKRRVFGQNSSSWKKLRNPANTSEFVQGHKNRALKKAKKSILSENVPTAKCTANTSTLGCFEHWQLEEEKQANNRFCKEEML